MKSVSGIYWEEEIINQRLVDKIKLENNFNELVSRLVVKNNFDKDEIFSIRNSLDFTNPFKKNLDFIKAVKILDQSIRNHEKICVIGDYDVDGCVSTSLIVKLLKNLKVPYYYHIPNRFTDGYGANIKLLKEIIKVKPDLIILVDNGSNSFASIEYLNKNMIKSIIIDHHEIYKPYPQSGSLINPKKEKLDNNHNYFCSALLTFFFIDLYLEKKSIKNNFEDNLTLVLMAIVSDVMPLRKINRLIALKVLKNFNFYNNYIFKKIFELKKIVKPIDIDDFAFLFGPIINSIGRLDDANDVVKLLSTHDMKIKDKIISRLISYNEKRKIVEKDALKEINNNKIDKINEPIIFITENSINEGITGVIASRLKYQFNKPSVVITKSGNYYKGSCRSTSDFNIGIHIKKALDLKIVLSGGGHNLAAGFSIQRHNINKLKKFLNKTFEKNKIIVNKKFISEISLHSINKKFIKELLELYPFGEGNIKPLFLVKNIRILKPKLIKNNFITCFLKNKPGKMIPAVSFNYIDSAVSKNILYNQNEVDLIIELSEKFWKNKKLIQLNILDLIYQSNNA